MKSRAPALLSLGAALVLATTSCSLVGGGDDDAAPTVTLVVHDSFALPDDVIADFEKTSGYQLDIRAVGDAGTLTNQLVLTKDNPLGDVAFGVDNTFGSRALDEGVFAPYDGARPAGVDDFALPGDDEHRLTPVDNSSVCVNVDDVWFTDHDVAPPMTFEDLTDPQYKNLVVTPSATKSSTGLAFLLATVGHFGDDWPTYWRELLDNGAEVTKDWENAYYVDFTQGGKGGKRPIVVSYDTSPAFTVGDDGDSTTSALLDTCFQQVEYAGVIEGAAHPEVARELVDFLLTPEVQESLPDNMYVFPVVEGTPLPKDWAAFAQRPTSPVEVAPEEIEAQRDAWQQQWSDLLDG